MGFFQYFFPFFYNLQERRIKKIENEQVMTFSNPSVTSRCSKNVSRMIRFFSLEIL